MVLAKSLSNFYMAWCPTLLYTKNNEPSLSLSSTNPIILLTPSTGNNVATSSMLRIEQLTPTLPPSVEVTLQFLRDTTSPFSESMYSWFLSLLTAPFNGNITFIILPPVLKFHTLHLIIPAHSAMITACISFRLPQTAFSFLPCIPCHTNQGVMILASTPHRILTYWLNQRL